MGLYTGKCTADKSNLMMEAFFKCLCITCSVTVIVSLKFDIRWMKIIKENRNTI